MRTVLAFTRSLTIGAVIALSALPAFAADIKTDSTITAATVFQDRATITRSATVDIPAGAHTVIFENMPVRLFPDSLRVEGTGNAQVTLGALSHKIVNQIELVVPREKEINDQIRSLQDKKLVIDAEIKALAKKAKFYEQLMGEATDRSREEIADFNLKPEQWDAAANTVASGIEQIEKAEVTKTLEKREIDEQITKLQLDLNQLRTGSKQAYQVSLPVETSGAAKLTLRLTYQMPNATWRPVYDARLDTKTGELKIIQYGAVIQKTGEDWNDIALTLSTARPQRGTSLPPIEPMWVNLIKNQMKAEAGRAVAFNGVMPPMPLEPAVDRLALPEVDPFADQEERRRSVASMASALIETGGFTTEYIIPGPSDVLADGTESKLLVGTFEADNELQIHVKPQISDEAYLVAHATLKGESPILPGRVNLFRDGAYVGQNNLPLLRPGKDHDIYYGIDDQIEVHRETLKDESGESGLLGRDNVKEQRYITTVHNLRQQPVKLAVTESVPVPRDEDIKVEVLKDFTTKGYDEDIQNKKGVMQWVQGLEAGKKAEIKLGWKVTWPKDQYISGL